jgi:thiol-disulfide isomerase/thioredoxin
MVLLFFACDNTSSSYKITGQFLSDSSLDGKTIYLENYLWYLEMSDLKMLDSAVIHGNKFEFKGKTDSAYMAVLTAANRPYAVLFVENGNINIEISEDGNHKNSVTGTKLNDLLVSYNQNVEPIHKKVRELMQYADSQERTEELAREVNEKNDALSKEIQQISLDFLDKNPGTLFSAFMLLRIMEDGIDDELIQSSYDKLEEQVKNGVWGKIIKQEIERAKIKEIAVDEPFRDMTMQTPDDREISISDYAGKGKYVLLDFWASWCGPCRAENPNIVALYKDYKDKGFEIVGVSLDNKKDAWLKGIKDDGIAWPQMSDLKGWASEAVIKYKVRGIPYTVLLDKEGKVIATNLRGEALINKIKTLIK